MHETMIAHCLLETISDEAAKYDGKPIAAKISCGGLSAVNDEILCFAFEAVAKDTPCEGMKLQIEHKPLRAKCRDCSRDFDVDMSMPKCAECSSENFELLADAPLLLEEIELQTD